jgi:uncharacterized protein (DUF433 family)
MNYLATDSSRAVTTKSRLLSLREAVVLAGVAEKEKCVRNDISRGHISASVYRFDNSHRCFTWPSVVSFAAAYGNARVTSPDLRWLVFENVFNFASSMKPLTDCFMLSGAIDWGHSLCTLNYEAGLLEVDRYLTINLHRVYEDVGNRIGLYATGLDRVEENESVLGGAAVFKGTRLSVLHVGKMAERSISTSEILEDYPFLTESDIEFARLYYRARPPRGRPIEGKREFEDGECSTG